LLTQPEELEKIQQLAEKFEPDNLPADLVNNGSYICGTHVNRAAIQDKHHAFFRRQTQLA